MLRETLETASQLRDFVAPGVRDGQTYTIFEGTSEIQRLLVIARAISGVHIP